MQYLAALTSENYEYLCISKTEEVAKRGVFDAYNIQLKKAIEANYKNPLVEATSEWLDSRLEKFYRHEFGGPISIETLEKKLQLLVLPIEEDIVYRDGTEVPTREQDY